MEDRIPARRAAVAAGLGGLAGAAAVYGALSSIGGGVGWDERLTFDQDGELELEALTLLWGVVLGTAAGLPLGAYACLRAVRAPAAGPSALLGLLAAGAAVALALALLPSGPEAPPLQPPVVFSAWLVLPAAAHLLLRARRGP